MKQIISKILIGVPLLIGAGFLLLHAIAIIMAVPVFGIFLLLVGMGIAGLWLYERG